MSTYFDIVILGAGPGGFVAAKRAAQAGKSVAIIEKENLGGTCLNVGCIPSKILLGASALKHSFNAFAKLKIVEGNLNFKLPALFNRKTTLIRATRNAIENNLKDLNIQFFEGTAKFIDANNLLVESAENKQISFGKAIIATGSRPANISNIAFDHEKILDSTDILNLSEVPQRLAIIGAGAIGLEMGDLWHNFGSQIVMIEAMGQIAPTEDEEVGAVFAQILKRNKWEIYLNSFTENIKIVENGVEIILKDKTEIKADKVLVVIGRIPNTCELQLENVQVKTNIRKYIEVDANLKCANNIYAIGDCNGKVLLAHAAEHQAEYVVRHILGDVAKPYEFPQMPGCIYGSIEVIRSGKIASELKKENIKYAVSKVNLAPNPIAQSLASTAGFVKIFWVNDCIVGITAIGHGVSHLVTIAEIITKQAWTIKDAEKIIFAHPTLDEIIKDAIFEPQVVV